jgi:DNA sulfur modification protein DndD
MKITRIRLENFRQHRKVEIELDDSHSSFTIVKGRNGAGKTNLLKAITWGLTGKLAKDEAKFEPTSLVSYSASASAKKGDILETSVRIDMDLGLSGSAQILRTFRFVKSSDDIQGLSLSGSELSVMLMEDKAKGYQKQPDPELWLEKIFPDRFSHYFLFDGEHLHRFFKDTEAAYVKKAVLEIANIDQLEKLVDHLGNVNQQLVKEVGSVAGVRGEELRKDYEYVEKKIEELRAEHLEKTALSVDLEEKLAEAQKKMGDIAVIQKDIAMRNQLESMALSASNRAAEARRELGEWAFKTGPLLMLMPQMKAIQTEIDDARSKNVLPPPYKPEALKALLEARECICGRDLAEKSDACKHVEALLAEFADLSEVGSLLSELQEPLQYANAIVNGSSSTLKSTQERLKTALADENDTMEKLRVISQKLVGHDDSKVAFIANQHDEAKRSRDSLLQQIGGLETQISNLTEKLNEILSAIKLEAASKEKSRQALLRQRFAESTLETAKKMYTEFSDQVRQKVAENLNDEFQSMVWKKNFFKPVEIDEDYRVLVYNKAGVEIRSMLSAGETACLAFAFSLTLSDVAGFSYPMVVDSPLGRLDKEVKEFVSDVLAKALKSDPNAEGKQILMLMTDSEYNQEVADALAHMKPKVCEIIFDEENSESNIGGSK